MSNESETAYGASSEAFKAIHSALYGLMAAPPGKRITKEAFSWNANGTLHTLVVSEGVTVLFTLTFAWNTDGTLQNVERS